MARWYINWSIEPYFCKVIIINQFSNLRQRLIFNIFIKFYRCWIEIIRKDFFDIVGIIKKNTIFRVNNEEVSELIFLPIEVLQNKTNIIWTSKKFGNKSYNFWKIKFLNYNIWGATASILANLSVKVWDTKLQKAIQVLK